MKQEEAKEAIRAFPELARKMAIGGQTLIVYRYAIDRGEVTTTDIILHLKVSSQHASAILKQLFDKEYLTRRNEVSKSGGYEWIYSLKL